MTPDQIQRVRTSFGLVHAIAEPAAALFYANLFDADPALRRLFNGDMTTQGRRLMEMIGTAVGLLDKPHLLMPALRLLGARHAGYGVLPRHYDAVGAALLATLRQGLNEAFPPATEAAWAAMYAVVSTTMIGAAQAETVAA